MFAHAMYIFPEAFKKCGFEQNNLLLKWKKENRGYPSKNQSSVFLFCQWQWGLLFADWIEYLAPNFSKWSKVRFQVMVLFSFHKIQTKL